MVVRLEIRDCRCWSLSKAVEANISTGLPSSSLTETYQVLLSLSVVLYRTPSRTSGSSCPRWFVSGQAKTEFPASCDICLIASGFFLNSSTRFLQVEQIRVWSKEVSFLFLPQTLQFSLVVLVLIFPVFIGLYTSNVFVEVVPKLYPAYFSRTKTY